MSGCESLSMKVNSCKRQLDELKNKITINKEWLLSHPNDLNVKQRLQALYQQANTKEAEYNELKYALDQCYADKDAKKQKKEEEDQKRKEEEDKKKKKEE